MHHLYQYFRQKLADQKWVNNLLSRTKIDPKSGCWDWIEEEGEAWYTRPRYCSRYVFHWTWEIFNGEIPEDQELHHVCRNSSCVNPNHLELMTEENHRRCHYPQFKEATCP